MTVRPRAWLTFAVGALCVGCGTSAGGDAPGVPDAGATSPGGSSNGGAGGRLDSGTGTGGAARDASVGYGGAGGDAAPHADAGRTDSGAAVDPSAVGTVGAGCPGQGVLACAGHAQKERLVCMNGTWQDNGTCATDENCDTTLGTDQGTCKIIVNACAGVAGGTLLCVGNDSVSCGVDLVTTTRIETCPFLCRDGACTGECVPGTGECNGLAVRVCDDSGVWGSQTTCAGSCSGGACSGTCTPGARRCNGGSEQVCDLSASWKDGLNCVGQACLNGYCSGVCAPGTTQCSDNAVQVCGQDGQWSAASPCQNQACIAGACTGTCTPLARQCVGDSLQTCGASGQWGTLVPCADQACVSDACTGVCAPGTKKCNGLTPQTCDGSGVWQDGTVCTAVCQGGACPGTCSPGATRCNGFVTQTCDGTGTWQDGATCTNQACVAGACVGVCTPGTQRCSGNGLETCSASGQWGAAVPCVASACVTNACTGVCVPGDKQCSGTGVQTCSATGAWSAAAACAAVTETCSNGACVACAAGTFECDGVSGCEKAGSLDSSCGTSCTTAACTTGQTCSGGSCVTCALGTTDCDGSAANGCEHVGNACCTSANPDADRYTDCQEDSDGIFSTSKYVFNGTTAYLVGNGGGNCTEICLASQIASLFAPGNVLETKNIYSGWEFDTKQPESQLPNSPTFGFQPPFTSTVQGWRMLYRGQFWVPTGATGQYCFNVNIGSDGTGGNTDTSPDACGAIYLPDVQSDAWVMNGRNQSNPNVPADSNQRTKCTTFATPGPKRIDFIFEYSNNNPQNRHQMHVSYCFGAGASCTPNVLITDTLLTPMSNVTIPTCSDGIQNGGETGIDCGGPDCAAC